MQPANSLSNCRDDRDPDVRGPAARGYCTGTRQPQPCRDGGARGPRHLVVVSTRRFDFVHPEAADASQCLEVLTRRNEMAPSRTSRESCGSRQPAPGEPAGIRPVGTPALPPPGRIVRTAYWAVTRARYGPAVKYSYEDTTATRSRTHSTTTNCWTYRERWREAPREPGRASAGCWRPPRTRCRLSWLGRPVARLMHGATDLFGEGGGRGFGPAGVHRVSQSESW